MPINVYYANHAHQSPAYSPACPVRPLTCVPCSFCKIRFASLEIAHNLKLLIYQFTISMRMHGILLFCSDVWYSYLWQSSFRSNEMVASSFLQSPVTRCLCWFWRSHRWWMCPLYIQKCILHSTMTQKGPCLITCSVQCAMYNLIFLLCAMCANSTGRRQFVRWGWGTRNPEATLPFPLLASASPDSPLRSPSLKKPRGNWQTQSYPSIPS